MPTNKLTEELVSTKYTLKNLIINDSQEDEQRKILIYQYDALLTHIKLDKIINIDKINFIINDVQSKTDTLIAKWDKHQ